MTVRRSGGVHGEVKVYWQLLPRDLSTFAQIQGHVFLEDGQTQAHIELQVNISSSESKNQFSFGIHYLIRSLI